MRERNKTNIKNQIKGDENMEKEKEYLSVQGENFGMEFVKRPTKKYTDEQWKLRSKISHGLESKGYDHLMSLDDFENMIDDIVQIVIKNVYQAKN